MLVPLRDFTDCIEVLESFSKKARTQGKRGGLREFCNWGPNVLSMIVPEDPLVPFPNSKISKTRVLVDTTKGQQSVSPKDFCRLVGAIDGDLICFPSGEPEYQG